MAADKKAVVFGARGTLGLALGEELPRGGWTVVAGVGHTDCDIRDADAVHALLDRTRPTAVFNAAAYTDVDRAEAEPELAHAINATGAENIARAAAAIDAAIVHYSTDFVFDGELERPYDENDPPSPQGSYAKSKVAGDAFVVAATPHHFVLRVGCLYGRGGRNFPSTIVRRLIRGETVRAVSDRWGSPTWVREVARVSAALASSDAYGLYHCTSQGETTWADFAKLAAALVGAPAERVAGVSSDSLELKAARPRRSILDNRRLRERGFDTLSTWQEALRAFAAEEMTLG